MLEDARESRAQAQQEIQLLQALRSDLDGTLSRLDEIHPAQLEVVEAARSLLTVGTGNAEPPPTSDLAMLYTVAGTWHRLEPLTGAYDAMIASGNINLISDQELLRRLATLFSDIRAGYEDGPESEALLLQMVHAQANYGLDHLTVRLGRLGISRQPQRGPLLKLLEDESYMHFLGRRALLELRRLEYFDGIRNDLQEVLLIIDMNLGANAS